MLRLYTHGEQALQRISILGRVAAVALIAGLPAAEAQGLYVGGDFGWGPARTMNTRAGDTDVPTNCDGHLPPITLGGEDLPLALDDPRCARGQDQWVNAFKLGDVGLAGLHAGRTWRRLRVEIEYFRRWQGNAEFRGENISGNKQVEFVETGERMEDVKIDGLFGNLYYDLPMEGRKLTPYIGAGLGLMNAKMTYRTAWRRHPDPDVIAGFGRHPAAAGTVTAENETLSDALWGYQVLAGADYAVRDDVSLGLKVRYGRSFGEFEDGDTWDLLRSHRSTVSPGGDVVDYWMRTGDLGFWAISITFKYFL